MNVITFLEICKPLVYRYYCMKLFKSQTRRHNMINSSYIIQKKTDTSNIFQVLLCFSSYVRNGDKVTK